MSARSSSFQDSMLNFSIYDQWFSQCFWDSWIVVFCRFNSYFTLITKVKLHFSLICSEIFNLYCCLVKEDWVLKVAYQFAIRRLVAYKAVACKKNNKCIKMWQWGTRKQQLWNYERVYNYEKITWLLNRLKPS